MPIPRGLAYKTRGVFIVQRSAENIWRFRVLVVQPVEHLDSWSVFHKSVSREAYVSFSFNFPRLGIAFVTVNVLVLDSSASLNIGKQFILYHRYFCSLPAHQPPPPLHQAFR